MVTMKTARSASRGLGTILDTSGGSRTLGGGRIQRAVSILLVVVVSNDLCMNECMNLNLAAFANIQIPFSSFVSVRS